MVGRPVPSSDVGEKEDTMKSSTMFAEKEKRSHFMATLVLIIFSFGLFAHESSAASQKANTIPGKAPGKVKRVEAPKVCMVNDAVFPNDQIPVPVNGRTYYGCCEMCKGRLSDDPEVRRAIDPVSKQPVDKALAVIGAKPDGKVIYFESEKTLRQYNADAHNQGGMWGCLPIIVLDVYEHAYFIDYGSDKKKYIEDFWKNFNWAKAEELYLKVCQVKL